MPQTRTLLGEFMRCRTSQARKEPARFPRALRSGASIAALLALALTASACSSGSSSTGNGAASTRSSTAAGSSPTASVAAQSVNKQLASLVPSSIRSTGVLRVATVVDQPPMDTINSSGQPAGMEIDLARALSQVLGLKVQFTETSFQSLIAGTLANRWDVIWAAMNDTPVREKQVTFIDYFKSGTTVMVKSGNPQHIQSPASFCGATFGEQQGSVYQQMLQQISSQDCAGKSPVTISTFPDFATVYSAIAVGRINAALQSLEGVEYYAHQHSGAFQALTNIQLQPVHYGIGIDPKDTGLVKAVQGALSQLIQDGTYAKILSQYGLTAGAVKTATINQSQAG